MSERDNDIDLLVALHLDDALDAPSAERLFAHLRTDVAARRLLLAAATQATVLPRVALEAGLTRPSAVIIARSPARWWRWSAAAAAAAASLLLAVGWWWTLPSDAVADVRLAVRADLVVMRSGERTAALTVQTGDRLEVGASGARLNWTSEGTGIDLDDGARVVIEQLGRHKRLRLERGLLTAEVAPQGEGGLSVITPFGVVDVVGTRFRVQVDDLACAVQVEHGAVRVSGGQDPTPVTVGAGFTVRLAADGQRSAPAPLTLLPTNERANGAEVHARSAPPARVVRLGVETYRASDGWEGDLVDGTIRGRAVAGSPVTRITTPVHRPEGFERFDAALRMTIDLTVDHPTTLAVLLVCDHPDGGTRWLANVQAERRIPAGAQQVTFRAEDFTLTTAGAQPLSASRIVAVAVMTWLPAADLRLRSLELAR